ncbi:hypothetical protein LH428_14380, partial [Laribacter hongkongensis]|uniref:hypothetical protein n=1 Tax=Laribacter hongkongensis TaxID=168471 RepID=UPI001EFE2250
CLFVSGWLWLYKKWAAPEWLWIRQGFLWLSTGFSQLAPHCLGKTCSIWQYLNVFGNHFGPVACGQPEQDFSRFSENCIFLRG